MGFSRRWLWIYAVTWLYFAAWCLLYILPAPFEAETVVYIPSTNVGFLLFLPPLFGFLLSAILYSLHKENLFKASILLIFTLIICLYILALLGPSVEDSVLIHRDSRAYGEHIYNFAEYHAREGGDEYILYECDRLGIICNVVYRTRKTFEIFRLIVEDESLFLYIGSELAFKRSLP